MKVTRIDHVSLNVHDHTEETQAFYEDLLGLSTTPRPKAFESFPGLWVIRHRLQGGLVLEPGLVEILGLLE